MQRGLERAILRWFAPIEPTPTRPSLIKSTPRRHASPDCPGSGRGRRGDSQFGPASLHYKETAQGRGARPAVGAATCLGHMIGVAQRSALTESLTWRRCRYLLSELVGVPLIPAKPAWPWVGGDPVREISDLIVAAGGATRSESLRILAQPWISSMGSRPSPNPRWAAASFPRQCAS